IFTLSRFAVQPELTKKDFELELTEILKNIALDPDLALNGSISREMPDLSKNRTLLFEICAIALFKIFLRELRLNRKSP
ncbi:MAG TPA: hypothetical protein VN952_01050, partial [Chthoniobacterales bacterium]|nr:hypothetical protein [Chthoniobacterales bacterium]